MLELAMRALWSWLVMRNHIQTEYMTHKNGID
jgi:hypothetical protein